MYLVLLLFSRTFSREEGERERERERHETNIRKRKRERKQNITNAFFNQFNIFILNR